MPVPPPTKRLVITRAGKSIALLVPKPVILVDTREQDPFSFSGFSNWVAGVEVRTLATGDYSVAGMETLVALERKSLSDLVASLTGHRQRFLRECERLSQFTHKAILIEATYEQVKSPYHEYTRAHPNAIAGSLDAVEARWGISVIYTSDSRKLAEEKAASWLSKLYAYWWLETHGYGRVLQEGDL